MKCIAETGLFRGLNGCATQAERAVYHNHTSLNKRIISILIKPVQRSQFVIIDPQARLLRELCGYCDLSGTMYGPPLRHYSLLTLGIRQAIPIRFSTFDVSPIVTQRIHRMRWMMMRFTSSFRAPCHDWTGGLGSQERNVLEQRTQGGERARDKT